MSILFLLFILTIGSVSATSDTDNMISSDLTDDTLHTDNNQIDKTSSANNAINENKNTLIDDKTGIENKDSKNNKEDVLKVSDKTKPSDNPSVKTSTIKDKTIDTNDDSKDMTTTATLDFNYSPTNDNSRSANSSDLQKELDEAKSQIEKLKIINNNLIDDLEYGRKLIEARILKEAELYAEVQSLKRQLKATIKN